MAYKQLKLWFDKELAIMLADKILTIKSDFDANSFISSIDKKVHTLELKDRVELFADELFDLLGKDYQNSIKVLLQILGPENEKETGMFKEFYWIMPIAKLVEKYGLNDFELSMQAIEEITKRNTGEYTIRPYLENETDKTLSQMKLWSKSENRHVRRLASEGVRPRLPWAKKLTIFVENPKVIIPILDNLKDDTSKYVQKSVANCINDILKDNIEIGKELIEDWNSATIGKERKWIIKHALRNLLKANDAWALKMVGK